MRKSFVQIFTVSVAMVLLSTISFAQRNDQTVKSAAGSLYVISAKAGVVNYVEGSVAVKKSDSTRDLLIKGDNVEVGEKILTDKDSKAEILLNPGSYARLGGNTEFEFLTTDLDDLKLQLNKGMAIFEVYASRDFKVAISTPKARFYLIDSGVYRVNVADNGVARLEVWKGKAQIGDINATEIKKKRAVTLDGSQVAVEKFDRDEEEDKFDAWSKERAKDLSKANARLQRKTLRTSLYNSFSNNRWNGFTTFGLWAYDPIFGSYCFLPFGYGWSSPYGFGLNRNFFSSRPSNTFYYNVQRRTYRNMNTGTTNQGSNNNRGANRGSRRTNPSGSVGNNPGRRSPGRMDPGNTAPRRVDSISPRPQRSISPSSIPRTPRSNPRVKSPTVDN